MFKSKTKCEKCCYGIKNIPCNVQEYKYIVWKCVNCRYGYKFFGKEYWMYDNNFKRRNNK